MCRELALGARAVQTAALSPFLKLIRALMEGLRLAEEVLLEAVMRL